jgi:hypothetical protein
MMIYMNKLYQEDLIWREFATADYNTWVQQVANNKPYIMFEYAARIAWANDAVKAVDPNTVWAAPKDFAHVTAYPNLGSGKPLTLWYLPYWYPAMWMSARNSPEKIARMLKVWNWYATDEGVLLTNMGVEGKTFQWVNGHAQYMPHIKTTANPSGTVSLGKYGLAYMLNYHLDHLAQTGAEVTNELSKKVEEYEHFENIKLAYNKTEQTIIADYETMVRDVTNEHVLKFIMGQLNPSSDADWKAFLDALAKANFDRVDAIKQAAYARKYK